MQEVFFNEKHSDRVKDVLKLLDGMTVSEAQEMLRWCGNFLADYTTVNWKAAVEKQKQEL